MQFRLWSAAVIFLGSYFPLALILLAQDVPEHLWGTPICGWGGTFDCTFRVLAHPWIAIGSVVVTLGSVGLAIVTINAVRLKHRTTVLDAKSISSDQIGYLLPYVVSFMGMDYGDPRQVVGFAVFWVVLFAVTYRSGQVLLNPLLVVMGWRLYDVTMKFGAKGEVRTVRVLKRGRLVPGIQLAEEVQDVYLMGDP